MRLMNKINTQLIISFMGVDGSGKTTLAKNLLQVFKNSRYLHLKPYILFQDRRTVVKNPQNQKKSSFIISLIRLISWFISYQIFFQQKHKKNIYIFDRYAHDILIDPLRYKHNLSYGLTKFILNFFPKPDLWIFLNPSLKAVESRKRELSYKELKRQSKDYIFFFKNKKNVLKLNKNIQKKKLIKIITKKINDLNT